MRISDWSSDVCSSDLKVTASGNVSLMEADGSVLFADYMELTGGMRDGFIRDAAMLLSDNSRGAAAYAERHNGNTTVLRKAIYTTCSLRSEEHTSELQSLMRNSYAVFCLKQKQKQRIQ